MLPRNLETLTDVSERGVLPNNMRLCLPTFKGFIILKLEDIVYCEAQRSYTVFHLVNGKTITISKPLFDYDKLLAGTAFLRIHKSFLINLFQQFISQTHKTNVVTVTMQIYCQSTNLHREKAGSLKRMLFAFSG